jgi:hypothetical protein
METKTYCGASSSAELPALRRRSLARLLGSAEHILCHSETRETHRSLPKKAAPQAGGPHDARAENSIDGVGKPRKRTIRITSCSSHSEGNRPWSIPLPISQHGEIG